MIIVGLGSNTEDRLQHLNHAIGHLQSILSDLIISPIYESEALLLPDSPESWNTPFLNMVVAGNSHFSPEDLLNRFLDIEHSMGRERERALWSPRTIDIDILAYHDEILTDETLSIPHKGLLSRPFCLYPLCDILPDWRYPVPGEHYQKTASELADELKERSDPLQTNKTALRITA